MSSEKIIPGIDLPGDLTCILAVVAQFWLGRRFKIPAIVTGAWSLAILFIYLCTQENLVPPVRRMLPAEYRANWIPALCFTYSLSIVCAAAILWLRDRIPAFRADRRSFLKTSTAALCVAPAAALTFGIVTRKHLEIKEVDIAIPGLAKDLQGLRLLQLSDIHIGDFFTPADLARVVDASNNLRPDVAFITGDLITTQYDPMDDCLAQLRRLRTASGLWGCMGNHEMYSSIQEETQLKAQRLGIRFLRHEAELLKFGNHHINLVGVDYQRRNEPYLQDVDDLLSIGSVNLLLSHNPDVFPTAAGKGFDLTLAGHTHGGQINFGVLGQNLNIADFFTPYTKGLYTLPGSSIYVNSGLGTIGMPVRLGAPPEITLIRLCNS